MCCKSFTNRLDFIAIVFLTCFSVFYFSVRRYKDVLNLEDNDDQPSHVNNSYTTKAPSSESTNRIEDNDSVDIVYTWVNGSDERFKHDLETFLKVLNRKQGDVLVLNRYFDFGPLKYSLRSVEQNANWIRKIFLVTNGQIPSWLRLDNPRLTLVTHEEIFQNKNDLPTFASQAVECHLHRIKGLSKKFIYMSNDIIFTSAVVLEDFVTQSGEVKVRFYKGGLKRCNKKCPPERVNNRKCDQICYTESCEWDGDDCIGKDVDPYSKSDQNFMFDAWKGSILHTYFLFNKAFGPRSRQIPNSGPHLFDKDILRQLNERFPDEWKSTSSQKLRHHLTVNLQFAYYNFLVDAIMRGISGIRTRTIEPTKCCEMEMLAIDNREDDLWKQQLLNTNRSKKLQKPKYLIVTGNFTRPLNSQRINDIKRDLENFFEKMFPKPSTFERKI
ncbi:N-acetylglucosamine-1-phosphotransferase subunits alpha/beta-like [Mercenaria mercenaria]|uniref:N-acetylglucosamine-1-phosphotransferase subunits alpha/beta-like n=1 Tax=Mercenaria mercenaria TaxID=6596 RepID=UPI00234E63DE|nr:N-acetylglucosamine-1-phosphotransferase subunits alpha/beta-like [Mercenaria mercenaria]